MRLRLVGNDGDIHYIDWGERSPAAVPKVIRVPTDVLIGTSARGTPCFACRTYRLDGITESGAALYLEELGRR